MSQQNQAKMNAPLGRPNGPGLPGSATRRKMGRGLGSMAKTAIIVVVVGLLGGAGLGLFMFRNEGQPRSADSELIVDQPTARSKTARNKEAATPAAKAPDDKAPAAPVSQQPGSSRRYRVVVGTAYFFDSPQQSTPNGKYLRRGDVFYGEGELNGFVKTGFENPDGTRSTGWLKAQELSALSEKPAPQVARRSKPRPPAQPAAPAEYKPKAAPAASVPIRPEAPARSSGQRAVVQAARSYFFDSPDLATPRKAHCVRGDRVRVVETRGNAVYVTFTNWEKVTTTGWMRKDALALQP